MKLKNALFYACLIVLVWVVSGFLNKELVRGQPPEINVPVINTGANLSCNKQQPGLIYFWASWCGICAKIKDTMKETLAEYPGITVAVKSGTGEEVARYLKAQGLNWAAAIDNEGAVGSLFGIRGVPTIFILDKDGNIKYSTVGYTSSWGLKIRLWLAGL